MQTPEIAAEITKKAKDAAVSATLGDFPAVWEEFESMVLSVLNQVVQQTREMQNEKAETSD